MNYIKLFVDFRANFEQLSEAEIGRLTLAIFDYAETGKEPDLKGNERFVWGAARTAIDHTRDFAEKQARNGAMNGKAKKANESQKSQTEPNEAKLTEKKRKEKKGNEKKGNINTCAEQSTAPVVTMPLNNGSEHAVMENDLTAWATAYPDIDIVAELRKMVVWLNANPSRRKTAAGINRFIIAWLARAEEAAPKKPKKASKYAEIYEKY